MRIRLQTYSYSSEAAGNIAAFFGLILFCLLLIYVISISINEWQGRVNDARHNKNWHTQQVYVEKSKWVSISSNTAKKKEEIAYWDLKDNYRHTLRSLPRRYKVGTTILGYVNNKGVLWIPHAENSIGDPFSTHSFWWPAFSILVFGVIANLIFVVCCAVAIATYLAVGKLPVLYRKEPITERILVHKADGSLKEETRTIRHRLPQLHKYIHNQRET